MARAPASAKSGRGGGARLPHLLRGPLASTARRSRAPPVPRRGRRRKPRAGRRGAARCRRNLATGALGIAPPRCALRVDRGALSRRARRRACIAPDLSRVRACARRVLEALVRHLRLAQRFCRAGGGPDRPLRGDRRPLGGAGRWRSVALTVTISRRTRRTAMDGWTSAAPIGRSRTAEFMASVYRWMAFGLALTGIVAWAVTNTPGLLSAFYRIEDGRLVGVTGLFWGVGIAELALVWIFASVVQRASLGAAVGMFLAYCALSGVTFSVYLLAYTATSIASTLFITGGAFFGLSVYGTVTKRNLEGWRSFLFIVLIEIILASLVNLFLRSNGLEFVMSCAGVVIFAGLTAYDTQKLHALGEQGEERHALIGALSLYLDFVNLFLFLLRFMGRRRE